MYSLSNREDPLGAGELSDWPVPLEFFDDDVCRQHQCCELQEPTASVPGAGKLCFCMDAVRMGKGSFAFQEAVTSRQVVYQKLH